MAIGSGLLFLALIATSARLGIGEQLRALVAADARVATIAWRLAMAGRPLCPRTAPLVGLTLQDVGQYAGATRAAARALLPTDDVTVTSVVAGGPAERAGLRFGDAIRQIDGREVLLPAIMERASYARTGATAAALDAALRHGGADLTVARGEALRHLRLVPEQGCRLRVQLEPGDDSDAGSDGDLVTLTTALYAATQNDDELAFVLGHELGHNILDAGQNARPSGPGAETRADALGIRVMARAGFDPAAAAPFVARMLGRRGLSRLAGSHPSRATRVRDLAREAAAIATRAAHVAP